VKGTPPPPPPPIERGDFEAQYLLNVGDDCDMHCKEFEDGLASVLRDDAANLFSQKRFCMLQSPLGYWFVGAGYVKSVEGGKEASRTVFKGEGDFRDAIKQTAGVVL